MAEQRETTGLAPAGRPKKIGSPADPISKGTLKEAGIDKYLADRARKLAALPKEKFEAMIVDWRDRTAQETERVTVNLLRAGEKAQEAAAVYIPEVPDGKFSTIVIDPPWSYSNKSGRHGDSANADYIQNRTMTLDEVALFNIERWVAEECHLYMWVTDAYLGHAYTITEAWGFKAKASLIWVKDRFGMGNYYRHQHEVCIFASRGTMRLKRMNASTVFKAPITKHSEKPEEFYRMVESCSPGPYIDVFARKKRPGWSVFGDQVRPDYQGTLDGRESVVVL